MIMGHEQEFYSINEKINKKAFEKEVNAHVAMATWNEGGHGLDHPIRWLSNICNSYDEAVDFIRANDKGWYDQLAVRYREYSPLVPSMKAQQIKEKIKQEIDKMNEYSKKHDVRNRSSKTVGCPNCGSRINKDYVRGNRFPLCKTDLAVPSVSETLAKYNAKINKLRKSLESENQKIQHLHQNESIVKWLVKIEYHV
jgi:uncharacterized protein YlaI